MNSSSTLPLPFPGRCVHVQAMIDQQTLLSLGFTVGSGAMAGGLTNAVAIWMLFHPYEEVRVGPLRLHGAISKNKARLARSIGKTVGERLLTPEDLAERLSAPAVREAFAEAVGRMADDLLQREYGSLEQILEGPAGPVLEEFVSALGPNLARRLAEAAETPGFAEGLTAWLERLREEVEAVPVGALLTPTRREAIRRTVDTWATDLAESDGLAHTIRSWVAGRLEVLEQDPRPLGERLPEGIVGPVEQAIGDYLPTAIERLGDLLGDPGVKSAITTALRDAFDGAAREMLLHERLLAKLVVKDSTFERLVSGLAGKGFERVRETLQSDAVRTQLAAAVRGMLLGLLRMPLGERLSRLGPEQRVALTGALGDWALAASRSPAARDSLQRALDHGLDRAGTWTWGQVLGTIPADQLVDAIRNALRSDRGQAWVAQAVTRTARDLTHRPLGRPAHWLGSDAAARIKEGLVTASWGWLRTQIPQVVERLRVPEMVEQKVLGFSMQRMEEIIRNVTQRELRLIVRLGYLLGGIVGLLAFGITRLL